MSQSRPTLPEDVTIALAGAFQNDADPHARILFFLADSLASGVADPYIGALRSSISAPAVFRRVAERMAEDTRAADADPSYRQFMQDVWSNFLKDSLLEDSSGGQRWDLATIPQDAVASVTQYAFMRAVSRMSPEAFAAIQQVAQVISGPMAVYANRALSYARQAQPVVRVALVAVFLAYDIIKNIKRWWNGEITGIRCAKNIIDNGVSVAAGIAGAVGGEMVGVTIGAVGGPVGMGIGAVVGGIAGGIAASYAANELCDKLTQWVFGLPKSEALENAYSFLGVRASASNSGINSTYRRLSLNHHPDRGGRRDDWTQLQYSMAVIREARGE